MKPSLSVILPVHNAEETLTRVVGNLLEFLPELTARFEIVVVDDASADHTVDIADELRRLYPQVRLARHGWQWGRLASVRTGRLNCRGELMLVLDSQEEVSPQELTQKWERLVEQARRIRQSSTERDVRQEQSLVRSEPAHKLAPANREPTFLRHLRSLSASLP
jgi:glycosyltransferase involved in cell wall biosynthesis